MLIDLVTNMLDSKLWRPTFYFQPQPYKIPRVFKKSCVLNTYCLHYIHEESLTINKLPKLLKP